MDFIAFYPNITEKRIPLSLLGVSSRVYFNWKKENLIYETATSIKEIENKNKRTNVYLSVYDALWVLIIKELRNFNLDINTIRELKNFIFSTVKVDHEIVNSISNDEFLNSILNNIPEEYHEIVKNNLESKEIEKFIDENIDDYVVNAFKYIGYILCSVLLLRKADSIVIIKETETSKLDFLIAQNNNNATIKEKEVLYEMYSSLFAKNTLINIPILPLVSQLFENEKLEKYCVDFGLFNANEKKILAALNDNTCKKITIIKYDSQNITFDFINETEVRGDKAKEIRKLLGLKQYQKVEISYRNDKHLIIKNNTREK